MASGRCATNPVTIGPEASIWGLVALLSRERISAVPVVDARSQAIGVVSASDLLWVCESLLHPGDLAAEGPRTVRELMTPDVLSVSPASTLSALCRFFARAGVHRALVLEEGKLVGIVSLTDLLGYLGTRDDLPSRVAR